MRIKSDKLRVEIAPPNKAPNNTYRFDRAGFITEVVLDGKHWFCASEPNHLSKPSSGGRGLCCEYKADLSSEYCLGSRFPKFGVGELLREDESPYLYYGKYDCSPFPVKYILNKDSVVFKTEPLIIQDYALRHTKTLHVEGNKLTMSVEVENIGRKPVTMEEYCHNFISIDGMAVDKGYSISIPYIDDAIVNEENSALRRKGIDFSFKEYTHDPVTISIPAEEVGDADEYSYTLKNTDAGAAVKFLDSSKPARLAIWAVDHIVSVESFHKSKIMPGESDSWMRQWTFYEI